MLSNPPNSTAALLGQRGTALLWSSRSVGGRLEGSAGLGLIRWLVQLDLDATGPPRGLVEHRAAGFGDVQHPRFGPGKQHGQSRVGGQGAQCRGIPTEDDGVELPRSGQQYPRGCVSRGTQRHSRLTLPPPGETLLGLPTRRGAAVHQPAAGAGGEYHPGASYSDAVSTQANQEQPDRARRYEVVEQIVHGEAGPLPWSCYQRTERHQDRCRRAITSRYIDPLPRDGGGQRPTVPGGEPLQEPGQSLGLHFHRAPTAG